MDLNPGEQIVFEGHPSARAALSFYLPIVLVIAIAAVVVAVVADVLIGIIVFVVAAALLVLVGHVKRTATDYIVSTQRLYIRTGIVSKHVQQTRIDRVQNVNTSQSLLDRILRVGTVDFDTASSDDSGFRFVGISEPAAIVAAVDRAQRTPDAAGL